MQKSNVPIAAICYRTIKRILVRQNAPIAQGQNVAAELCGGSLAL